MSDHPVSVTLALGSAPYQKTLASSLASGGMLRRVLNVGPDLEIQEPGSDGKLRVLKRYPLNRFATRVVWGIWRRLPDWMRGDPPVIFSVTLADWLVSRWIEPSSIFHGYAGVCLKSLQVAKRQGAITVVEAAARHPRHWRESAVEECRRFGADVSRAGEAFPEVLVRRMEREYQLCGRIVVNSANAAESFAQFGYAEKTVLVHTGVDADFYSPGDANESSRSSGERSSIFRVCYVGRVEFAKGLGYLLQAWKRLALRNAELVLVGEVKPEVDALLKSCVGLGVRATGFALAAVVARHYRESSVFVFPSANEGLAQVLLEAMASGLVIVATDRSGACECVTEGKDGLIVPGQDVDALADAILWCYQHPEEVRKMGKAARAKIESRFTLEHYNQRVIALYRSLVQTYRMPFDGDVAAAGVGR